MKKIFLHLIIIAGIFSCNEAKQPAKEISVPVATKTISDTLQQRTAAKEWLVKNIENYFSNFDKLNGNYASICTKQYAEFKTDATNVGLDGGMTEAAFKNKWGRRYSPYAGIGEGFLVAGSDFGKIKVTSCQFSNDTEMGGWLFKTIIEDTELKSKFIRDIVVMPEGRSFLIDDVKEKENMFAGEK